MFVFERYKMYTCTYVCTCHVYMNSNMCMCVELSEVIYKLVHKDYSVSKKFLSFFFLFVTSMAKHATIYQSVPFLYLSNGHSNKRLVVHNTTMILANTCVCVCVGSGKGGVGGGGGNGSWWPIAVAISDLVQYNH